MKELLKKVTFADVLLVGLTVNALFRLDWVSAALVALALVNYLAQKFLTEKAFRKQVQAGFKVHLGMINDMTRNYVEHSAKIQNIEENQEKVTKLAADMKKSMSEASIAGAFVPRAKRTP